MQISKCHGWVGVFGLEECGGGAPDTCARLKGRKFSTPCARLKGRSRYTCAKTEGEEPDTCARHEGEDSVPGQDEGEEPVTPVQETEGGGGGARYIPVHDLKGRSPFTPVLQD
ncbi:unnamed protein product [Staurois parvus]|uniref:Uncharacterized protein n=1 Tax=Staurois parvus TaxID=386267 RepID=A0ABN9HKQ9_9NEOB|nr:unnamed protein product [Staurois parvus]